MKIIWLSPLWASERIIDGMSKIHKTVLKWRETILLIFVFLQVYSTDKLFVSNYGDPSFGCLMSQN